MLNSSVTSLSVALDQMRVNPLRTILSTLGVIIGVGALVAVLSLGDGMERTARERIESTTDLLAISLRTETTERIDGDFFPLRDTLALDDEGRRAIAALPTAAGSTLLLNARLEVRTFQGGRRRMADVIAMRGTPLGSLHLAAGRPLTPEDDSPGVRVVVASDLLARRLAGDSVASHLVGQRVLLGPDTFSVVGVLSPAEGAGAAQLFLPYAPAAALLGSSRRVLPQLVARARSVEDLPPLRRAVEQWLATRYPNWKGHIQVATYQERAEQVAQGILIFKLVMGAITGISLLVGGIGIMNVLLASVTERTREIGIRKAMGARQRDILRQFLAESVAISGLGSMIGIVIGLASAVAITGLIRRLAAANFVQATFSWGSVVAAAAASLAIGLIFGTYPARRAARLSPIEAIRHE